MQNEMEGLLITINLPGAIGGPKKQKDEHELICRIGENILKKKIIFNPRDRAECKRKVVIQKHVAESWVKTPHPGFKDKVWFSLPVKVRLSIYVESMDEGFGVSFEEL